MVENKRNKHKAAVQRIPAKKFQTEKRDRRLLTVGMDISAR